MKRLLLFLLIGSMLLCGCNTTVTEETDTTDTAVEETPPTETEVEENEPEKPIPVVEEDVNPDVIQVLSVEGLNEVIYLQVERPASSYVKEDPAKIGFRVSYRPMDEAEFMELDKELYLSESSNIGCYILGLPEGKYCVKIECGEGETYARKTFVDIDVERQDRSGYAYFNREEGIGGYNKDGSVKENAVILYVNNKNKNTVTLDINGTTYTGLVEILQAKQYMEEPLIIRVTDKISTNQWNGKTSEPRLADDSNLTDDYFENEFSTRYKENLAGLLVKITDGREGKVYVYHTTPDGIELTETQETEPSIEPSKFEEGQMIYSDLVWTNELAFEYAKDLTIEGVGPKAEFYQFGIRTAFCESIELRNMTMGSWPGTALIFQHFGAFDSDVYHGNFTGGYWIHNNTFKIGQNNWVVGNISAVGDDTLEFSSLVQNVTISYNAFYDSYKAMLIGTWEKSLIKNVTIHHNYYVGGTQRFPLTRGANIHSYNNVYHESSGGSIREVTSNFFSESNWYITGYAFYSCGPNLIKSWNDAFINNPRGEEFAVVVTDREQALENNQCSPDGVTDYSRFDTDPELFYYDAENKCTDVDLMLDTAAMGEDEVAEWMRTYAGAGKYTRLELDGETAE